MELERGYIINPNLYRNNYRLGFSMKADFESSDSLNLLGLPVEKEHILHWKKIYSELHEELYIPDCENCSLESDLLELINSDNKYLLNSSKLKYLEELVSTYLVEKPLQSWTTVNKFEQLTVVSEDTVYSFIVPFDSTTSIFAESNDYFKSGNFTKSQASIKNENGSVDLYNINQIIKIPTKDFQRNEFYIRYPNTAGGSLRFNIKENIIDLR
ncbi:MAG: hypothetical protein PF517_05570 [Salinivirgaceae bacterium]|nr:hypothetical protein [Salinivirgaceae bacterium]